MRLLATISLGLALCASGANAQLRPSGTNGYDLSERALESATVRMFLQSDGNGKLVARECPNCTPMRLIVTPKTQVFMGRQSDHMECRFKFWREYRGHFL